VNSATLPADIYFKSGFELKNRDVIKKQQFLFTRVNIKRKSNSSTSLDKSRASLYAQKIFALYINGQVQWKNNFLPAEKRMLQSIYNQVTSTSAILEGLTLIDSFPRNGLQSYIYAANAPQIMPRKLDQDAVIDKIQKMVNSKNSSLDYFTYFELALRHPELFSPKLGLKQLSKFCGQNFIFFLLGMDLADPKSLTGISKVSHKQLTALNKYQIAVLIDERAYDTNLALAFAQKLLEMEHEEIAKLTVRNGCRLEKSSEAFDKLYKLTLELEIEPSGSYRYPINSFSQQQIALEVLNFALDLSPLSEAILNSLGDVPLKSAKVQQFIPTIDYSKLSEKKFWQIFQELQSMQEKAITEELLEATGDLLHAGGYPLMAYCFWHQALYIDPKNETLRKKIIKQINGIDISNYSKLISP